MEWLAVAIIVIFILVSTADWLYRLVLLRDTAVSHFQVYRQRLGRSLLLGLEILVAADVVRTVALEPSLVNLYGLALLVVVRTFLSWSIILEIEGRWPWERRQPADVGGQV
jgi:uncharacterized membrane protein